MKRLTVTEFGKFFGRNNVVFAYDTENQPNGELQRVKIVQKYTRMVYMLNPNRIMFSNEQGTICFNGVKYIRLYNNNDTPCYFLFSIVCGNRMNSESDFSYTFIADRVSEKNFSSKL